MAEGVTAAEIGELVARIFDRLESDPDLDGVKTVDAMVLVEVSDPNNSRKLDGRDVLASAVLLECTSDRVTVQGGILKFADENLIGASELDDLDDEDSD